MNASSAASTSSAAPRPSSPSTDAPTRSATSSMARAPLARSPRERPRRASLRRSCAASASTDSPMVGHFDDSDVVVDFVSRAEMPRLAALGTSCPDHFLRTKVAPLVLDLPADRRLPSAVEERLRELHAAVQRVVRGLLRPPCRARLATDAWRGSGDRARAGCRHVLVRQGRADGAGRRRVLRQRDQRDARRRIAVDVPADRRAREVPHRVLAARGGQASAPAEAEAAWRPASRWSPALDPASGGRSRCASHPRVPASSSRISTPSSAADVAGEIGDCRPRDRRVDGRHLGRAGGRRRSPRPRSPSEASTSSSTTPVCRSPSRCSRRPSTTGTCSTT